MAAGGYHHYRLPLIRAALGSVYRLETIAMQRAWHVRGALRNVLATRGCRFALLDMGCGLGDDIFAFAPSCPDATFTGVDHVAGNVAICRAYATLRRLENVTFHEADIRTPGAPASIDVALLATVLQYVDDPLVPLRNARAMLVPEGVLLVFQDVYAGRNGGDLGGSTASVRDHHRQYTPADVIDFVERAGFHVERTQFCQGRLAGRAEHALRRLLYVAKRGTASAILAAPLLAAFMPAYLAMQWIDFRRPHRSGTGLLIVARPQAPLRS